MRGCTAGKIMRGRAHDQHGVAVGGALLGDKLAPTDGRSAAETAIGDRRHAQVRLQSVAELARRRIARTARAIGQHQADHPVRKSRQAVIGSSPAATEPARAVNARRLPDSLYLACSFVSPWKVSLLLIGTACEFAAQRFRQPASLQIATMQSGKGHGLQMLAVGEFNQAGCGFTEITSPSATAWLMPGITRWAAPGSARGG